MFRPAKGIEHRLERAPPGRYASRHELVPFSTVPYAQVERRVRRRQRLIAGAAVLAGVIAAGVAGIGRVS
ncbi:hypothetical protein [Streptosporangium carneum]|uniref:Uncharacterized protein n=1 Tax=Streptosporangium carneum TaxID=47481 RepID=A0A9W6I7N5_9ACTN|nr:hypothetical protein [Streptosporangium carneum]GLK12698.1 hypothetical protein GCM10017600_61080 [Streptosporangium carneum]